MTQSEINAALIRALENLLALAPDIKVNGALRHIAGAVLQEARETLALAKGGDHA